MTTPFDAHGEQALLQSHSVAEQLTRQSTPIYAEIGTVVGSNTLQIMADSVDPSHTVNLPAETLAIREFVLGMCSEAKSILEDHLSGRQHIEKILVHDISRQVSLLVQAAAYHTNINCGDRDLQDSISNVVGIYLVSLDGYMYAIASRLAFGQRMYKAEDLVAEGQIGLIEALSRFDHRYGTPGTFASFARQRILGSMIDALRQNGDTIRSARTLQTRYRVYENLALQGKSLPEIAIIMDVPLRNLEKSIVSYERAQVASLDEPAPLRSNRPKGEDGPPTRDTIIGRCDTESAALANMSEAVDLKRLIDGLSERNADILRMRFGIDPYESTFIGIEIADKHHISNTRVSQIIDESLKLLRSRLPYDATY